MTLDAGRVVQHLEALVGFDTQNPPRNLTGDAPIFHYLVEKLGSAFTIDLADHGEGRVSLHARRGEPDTLFNAHIDTVPVLDGARFPPLELNLHEDRLYGRGACDIKGAAACLLALAEHSRAPLGVLFTSDEEGGEGCCVERFIASEAARRYRQVIVAEPTGCRAEYRHRGFLSVRGRFRGSGGHSSEPHALEESAVHRLARWSAAALQLADEAERAGRGTCFNIGTVAGGVKSNVIADRADVFWSARLPPGESNRKMLDACFGLEDAEHADWRVSFTGPPLPSAGNGVSEARAVAERFGLETGEGLDFWTEASLFSASGLPSLVLGPGRIEQAHAVDEWVSLGQLRKALEAYRGIVDADV